MPLFILLLLAHQSIFSHAALCTDCEVVDITFAGTSGISPMIKQWAFAYSLLRQDVGVTYSPTGGASAYTQLTSKCRENWLLDAVFSDINYFILNSYPGANWTGTLAGPEQAAPFFAGALGLTYNVPEIKGQQLYLTRQAIHNIYTQNITHWNDPQITSIQQNKGLALPNQPITLVVHDGNDGPTVTVVAMVYNYEQLNATKDEIKNVPRNPSWPNLKTFFKNGTYYVAQNDFAMVSQVLTVPYTLGYAPLAFVEQAALDYAMVQNMWGNYVTPNITTIQAAIDAALHYNSDSSIFLLRNYLVGDAPGYNTYPLSCFYYFVYHKHVEQDCTTRRETWKFLNWILTSNAAYQQIAATAGYAPFSASFTNQVYVNHVLPITCGGEQLVANEFQETDAGIVGELVIAFASVLMMITLIFILTLGYKRKNRVTKAAGLAFALSFLIGCWMNYISIFFWAGVPNSDGNCHARYILVSLGYSLIFGSMFAKCWEIHKAFVQAKTGDVSPFQELPWWKFCQVFAFVLAINAIILLGLGAVDAPRSVVRVTDSLNLIAVHVCDVTRPDVWLGLQFTYFGVLVVWGGSLAYKTRDIWERYNYPNESKSILLSIYNVVFCLVVLTPLINALESNSKTVFFLTCVAIIFPTSFCLFTVCGSKVATIFGSSFHASQNSQHTSKKSHIVKENKAEKAHDSIDENTRRKGKSPAKDAPTKDEKNNEDPRELSDDERPDDVLQRRNTAATLRNTETVATKMATEIAIPPQDEGAWNVS